MRAEMNENGCITISAESPLEAFALRRYAESGFVNRPDATLKEGCFLRGSHIIIDGTWEKKEEHDSKE